MRIYRRYVTYHHIDTTTVEVTERYSVWIPQDYKWWVHWLPGYLPDLTITNGDGQQLPILSDHEMDHFIRKANPDVFKENEPIVTQDILKKISGEQVDTEIKIKSPTANLTTESEEEARHYIAIMLPKRTRNYFDEITIKYVQVIEKTVRSTDFISRHVEKQKKINRTTTNSDYIKISTKDKYQIIDKKAEIIPETSFKPNDEEIKQILANDTTCVYRIKRKFNHAIIVKWKIGVPPMVRLWSWVGLLLGIGMLILSFSVFKSQNFETFKFSVGLVAGLVTIILSFRQVLFHDSGLMYWWNRLYLILLAIAICSILCMAAIVNWSSVTQLS